MSPPELTIRPSRATLGSAVIMGPIVALSLWSLFTDEQPFAAATAIAFFSVTFAWTATLRVSVARGRIVRRVFWRTTWSIDCGEAVLAWEVRDVPKGTWTALRVRRRVGDATVGEII